MAFKLTFLKVRKVILVLVVLVGVFSGGYYLGVQGYRMEVKKALNVQISRQVPPDKDVDFSLFWQVWDTLSAKYYDKTKLVPSEMIYGAIAGMTSALGDPYTMFLSPRENKVVDEDLSGSFEGVGIEIGYRLTRLAVISPLSGSPAETSGVKAGDFIVHIKDEKRNIDIGTNGIGIAEAVQAIRGPAGSKVILTLIRDGEEEPVTAEITRAKLDVPSVTLKFVGEGESIAHIRVAKFSGDTLTEWNQAVTEIISRKTPVSGIIVDLRNDPGGYLQGAIDIAGDFLPTGTTAVIEQRGDGSKTEHKTDNFGRLQKYTVVVLINEGSASASEILAGALRDQRDFKILGEKSFGKGTIQEPIEITGGSGLHVTTARWLTPKGVWIHEAGIDPDTIVVDDENTDEDEQLQKAIEAFNS
ncbi:MAG: Carboxyl-terminal protease [Candidatus Woesebacteria bacterium GW2011_GWB1_45_5]|uniref:Carboxyl-terminal protease n=1 Tax=Candidatus Woesebacteria bacterium GW2011_GWB1_45_5 TaxID=1618581 RepID=A0A0G1PUY5_9BACT|nr:MAG: Carboxyl-terminal protease [Candidatus Woesebacteria bacterium GW2011_GWB1_45_5]